MNQNKRLFLMTSYRYKLNSKIKKLTCPECESKLHFVRYYDIETKQPLPEQYGKCDNAGKCGYHCNPYKDGYHKNQVQPTHYNKPRYTPP